MMAEEWQGRPRTRSARNAAIAAAYCMAPIAPCEKALVASMVTHRRSQLAEPAEPSKHVRIAVDLRNPPDLGECLAKITDKVAGNILVFDHRERLQSQRKSLDLLFENLF